MHERVDPPTHHACILFNSLVADLGEKPCSLEIGEGQQMFVPWKVRAAERTCQLDPAKRVPRHTIALQKMLF